MKDGKQLVIVAEKAAKDIRDEAEKGTLRKDKLKQQRASGIEVCCVLSLWGAAADAFLFCSVEQIHRGGGGKGKEVQQQQSAASY